MSEFEFSSQRPEENVCIPLTKEASDKALREYTSDPDVVIMHTQELMEERNAQLSNGLEAVLDSQIGIDEVGTFSFLGGSVITYKLLDAQAKIQGNDVPVITSEAWEAHMEDQKVRQEVAARQSNTQETYITQQMKEIRMQDKEFGEAIDTFLEYENIGDRNAFFLGALNTYLPIKKAQDAQKLRNRIYPS